MDVSFLNLPQAIRYRIYRYSGMPTGVWLHLQYIHGQIDFAPDSDVSKDALSQYLQTRSTNRAMADDTTAFVCASNQIMLCCAKGYDKVDILTAATPQLLQHLRRLTIHLNVSYAWYDRAYLWAEAPRPICDHWPASNRNRGDTGRPFLEDCAQQVLTIRQSEPDGVIDKWQKAMNRLSNLPSDTLANLQLVLIADVVDAETSELISSPLQELDLARCTVRFGAWDGQHDLRDAAIRTVAKSTTDSRFLSSFPFLQLPTELQICILNYTDLITPHRQVHWLEHRGYWIPHHSFHATCHDHSLCSTFFAVYPPCKCWQPPTSLFLVSRDFRHLAQRVFYSSNRFIFADNGTTNLLSQDYKAMKDRKHRQSAATTAASWLLRVLQFDALHWVCEIELIFDDSERATQHMNEEVLLLWSNALTRVGSSLRGLRVRLYLNVGEHDWEFTELRDTMPNTTVESGQRMHEECLAQLSAAHHRFLQPLLKLEMVDRVSIYAAPPWEHSRRGWEECTWVQKLIDDHIALLRTEVQAQRQGQQGTSCGWAFVSECLQLSPNRDPKLSHTQGPWCAACRGRVPRHAA